MIKTYDEALKTLNDIRTYLAINRADDCVEELDKVARYFINEKHKENPTFEQCIKKWEERGYIIELGITHMWISTVDNNTVTTFDLCDKCVTTSLFIDYELSVLIAKTLKALEEMKNE